MSSNSCWSTTVQPGVPCKVTFPAGAILNITGFSLDIDPKQLTSVSGKMILSMSVNGAKPVTVMSFIVGRYDSSVVNILLGKNDSAILTSSGANFPVHVSGCLVNYKSGSKAAPTTSKVSSTASKPPPSASKKAPTTAAKKAPAASKAPQSASKTPATSKPPPSASKNIAAKKTPATGAPKKAAAPSSSKKPVATRHAPPKK